MIPEGTTDLSQSLDNIVFGTMKTSHKSYLQKRIINKVLSRHNPETFEIESHSLTDFLIKLL